MFAVGLVSATAVAEEKHDHEKHKKWHCEKKIDGKITDLDNLTRNECKRKGGKWKKGHDHDEDHNESDGHDHS
jgi:hypothetical protein